MTSTLAELLVSGAATDRLLSKEVTDWLDGITRGTWVRGNAVDRQMKDFSPNSIDET